MKEKFLIIVLSIMVIFYTGCSEKYDSNVEKASIGRFESKIMDSEMIANTDDYLNNYAEKIIKDERIRKAIIIKTASNILIGVKLQNDTNPNQVTAIKNDIKAKVTKDFGNNKDITIITADKLISEMELLAKDIKDNRPIAGFFEKMGTLIREVIPVI